jgi:hypothetical protein
MGPEIITGCADQLDWLVTEHCSVHYGRRRDHTEPFGVVRELARRWSSSSDPA